MTDRLQTSDEQGIPDWVPTLAVERLARECQKAGTIEVSTKVLGSLLFDLLKHRHVKWREKALGFLKQVIDGRGCEDEWPALAEFIERSETRLEHSAQETPAHRHTDECWERVMRRKRYSVVLKAEIRKGTRMQAIVEVEIPVATLKDAVAIHKPHCRAIFQSVTFTRKGVQGKT